MNSLKRPLARKVEDFVLMHKGGIEAGTWSQARFAELATEKLGFTVLATNVAGAAKTVEVVWPRQKLAGNTRRAASQSVRADIQSIAKELCALSRELDREVSLAVLFLAGGDHDTNGKAGDA